MTEQSTIAERNRAAVRAAFDRWQSGTGNVFELLADDADWTIAGSSPMSRTYRNKKEFLDQVIGPFNARMKKPLVPRVRGLYADGDMVIAFFDAEALARDDQPYRNTYTWYLRMKDGRIASATAFFDTHHFDELWRRVTPRP
jgi:uncharacterized protein